MLHAHFVVSASKRYKGRPYELRGKEKDNAGRLGKKNCFGADCSGLSGGDARGCCVFCCGLVNVDRSA